MEESGPPWTPLVPPGARPGSRFISNTSVDWQTFLELACKYKRFLLPPDFQGGPAGAPRGPLRGPPGALPGGPGGRKSLKLLHFTKIS